MDKALLDRRTELLKGMAKGRKITVVAEEMTKGLKDLQERERTMSCIFRDWTNRDRWIDQVIRINDKSYLSQLIASMDEAVAKSWVVYEMVKNPHAKLLALRTVIMGKSRTALLLMKAGVIQQAPQQIESTMTITGTPFDIDPKLKQALIEESERQRGEKENAQSGATDSRQE